MRVYPPPRLVTDAMTSTGPSASRRLSMPGAGTAPIAAAGPPVADLPDLGTSSSLPLNWPPSRITNQADEPIRQTGGWRDAGGNEFGWEEC